MTRREYTDRVLSAVHGLTWAEQAAVRDELHGHMEDCYLSLLDYGYPEDVAEERTISRMGDPEEVGRELAKQYPVFWRVVVWLMIPLFIYMVVFIAFFAPDDEISFGNNNVERFSPRMHVSHSIQEVSQEDVDIRFDVGNDQVRVLQVAVGAGQASVYMDSYNKLPFGPVARLALFLENQRGERGEMWEMSSGSGRWRKHGSADVSIDPEDTYVILCCEQYGADIHMQIPLPKEAVP